jgi:hypothetical protein
MTSALSTVKVPEGTPVKVKAPACPVGSVATLMMILPVSAAASGSDGWLAGAFALFSTSEQLAATSTGKSEIIR